MVKSKIQELFENLDKEEVVDNPVETQQESQEQQTQEVDQQQQQERLLAGKFSSIDDLEKSYEELQRQYTELTERLRRAEASLEAFLKTQNMTQYTQLQVQQQNNVPLQQTNDFDIDVDPYSNPKEYAKKIYEKTLTDAINRVQQMMLIQQQMEYVRQKFYSENPDLKGKERIVGLVAQDVVRDMPNADLDTVLKEVARRTREFLASLVPQQKPVQQPVAVTPQVGQTRQTIQTKTEERELTPEEEYQEYINYRKQRLAEAKNILVKGGK
jgi:hypothetical protein